MVSQTFVKEADKVDVPFISDFLKRNLVIHRHLDWRTPLEWIGNSPFLLLEKKNRIQSLLACPPDPIGVYWIRILASLYTVPIEESYETIFPIALDKIHRNDKDAVIISIAYQDWMKFLLSKFGWEICQQVVQLRWERANFFKLNEPLPEGMLIRSMVVEDIPEIALIDQASFEHIWQHSEDSLLRAFHQPTYCTVAEKDGIVIGYQITTLQRNRAHIARLAVMPTYQNLHAGSSLVMDVISQFHKPWAREISVNTQENNKNSLGLYKKLGFEFTEGSFPIYIYKD